MLHSLTASSRAALPNHPPCPDRGCSVAGDGSALGLGSKLGVLEEQQIKVNLVSSIDATMLVKPWLARQMRPVHTLDSLFRKVFFNGPRGDPIQM